MKKSIIFMIHSMNVGGTEKSLLSLISAMDFKEYSITVFMLEKSRNYLDFLPKEVTKEYLINYSKMKDIVMNPPLKTIKKFILNRDFKNAYLTMASYFKAKVKNNWVYFYKQVLKKYPIKTYDIAVAYAGPLDFVTYFITEKIKAKKKIQWIHFDLAKIKFNENFTKKYYSKFDVINCVSDNSRNQMQQFFPNLEDKIFKFKNIVNHDNIVDLAKKGETFNDDYNGLRIVTLGRLSHEKGQQMIPDVVEKLINDGYAFRWYIIGDGILYSKLLSQIKSKKIEKQLWVLGLKLNPYAYIKDSNIYVQTSLHEGYGLTINEAKILKKPIVTTNFEGINEQITHKETGYIVPISTEGLYQGVKEILQNDSLRKKLSFNLKKEAESLKKNEKVYL